MPPEIRTAEEALLCLLAPFEFALLGGLCVPREEAAHPRGLPRRPAPGSGSDGSNSPGPGLPHRGGRSRRAPAPGKVAARARP